MAPYLTVIGPIAQAKLLLWCCEDLHTSQFSAGKLRFCRRRSLSSGYERESGVPSWLFGPLYVAVAVQPLCPKAGSAFCATTVVVHFSVYLCTTPPVCYAIQHDTQGGCNKWVEGKGNRSFPLVVHCMMLSTGQIIFSPEI